MNKVSKLLLCGLLATSVSAAHATTITSATVYTGTPDPTNAGDPANFSATLPNASFTIGASGINYTNSANVSVATFLNNPTFSNFQNGFSPSTLVNGTGGAGTELQITGTTYLLQGTNSLEFAHDDGATISIPGVGLFVNTTGPQSANPTPGLFNNAGPAGNYSFTIDYSECCNAPETLIVGLNGTILAPTASAVPEPSSLALLGSGFLGLCGVVRRRIVRSV